MLKNANPGRNAAPKVPAAGSLKHALKQSVEVKGKVEECAVELSSVNAVLTQTIAAGAPSHVVERALAKSENVEAKVQECAADLGVVADTLEEEIRDRNDLELHLLNSNAALSASRVREEASRHSALHDAVTGLPNLTLFNDRLSHALEQARRHTWRLAVMFIDLDKFKAINDTHGHDAGDQVLQLVAQRLEAVVRSGDTVSRRSGDEFLFLMLEAKDQANAEALALKIIDHIAQPCEVGGVMVSVRPSIGVAIYPEDGQSAQELLKNADTAMYAAKGNKSGASLYRQMAAV